MKKAKKVCATFTIMLLITLLIISNVPMASAIGGSEMDTDIVIKEFEYNNPVYSISVYKGTTFDGLMLPDTLRAIVDITEEERASFEQEIPLEEKNGNPEFFYFGYIAPANEEELRTNGEKVIYTINYGNGDKGYRVYGRTAGNEPSFYSCDKDGNITGKVITINVSWNSEEFKPEDYDNVQELTPMWDENIIYRGEKVYAEVKILNMTEAEAKAEEELENETEAGTETNSENSTDEKNAAANNNIQKALKFTDSAPLKAQTSYSATSSVTYAQAMDKMKKTTITVNNKNGMGGYASGIPGTWKDYVNTIWMNKAANKFKFAGQGEGNNVPDNWKWNGKIADVNGDPKTNPSAIPKNIAGTGFEVYSVQQLLYALKSLPDNRNIDIKIMKDLDFNGAKYNWDGWYLQIHKYVRSLKIDGQNHSFYNIFSYSEDRGTESDKGMKGTFFNIVRSEAMTVEIKNLTFDSAFSCVFTGGGGGLFGYYGYNDKWNKDYLVQNVAIENSLFYNGGECEAALEGKSNPHDFGRHIAPFGALGTQTNRGAIQKQCRVKDCFVYGADHVCGNVARVFCGIESSNSCVVDTIICGTGGHSAGFLSCQSENIPSKFNDCFTNIEMYGSKEIAGFSLLTPGEFNRCFSTGKIEGFEGLYGFQGTPAGHNTTVKDCYSTALVGMRSEAKRVGGFTSGKPSGTNSVRLVNCYAAGEVGDHTTDMINNSTRAGGFAIEQNGSLTYSDCFYDKQTTAMREWVTAYRNTGEYPGIKGVLTTETAKGGKGLTSVPASGGKGFTGFTGNNWYYEDGMYPQLKSMRYANKTNWGSDMQASIACATSIVSTTTVLLDTWDSGYDWNSNGVRSKDKVSYARTIEEAYNQSEKSKEETAKMDHLGYEYTYDTVREIISDFRGTHGSFFNYSVSNGANTAIENWKTGSKIKTKGAFEIGKKNGNNKTQWKVKYPGMEWFKNARTITMNGVRYESVRPMRLIAFMNVEAGQDRTLSVSDRYDHRQDVELTMMDKLSPNMVLGFDDAKVWSTSALQGYPGYQAKIDSTDFGNILNKDGGIYKKMKRFYYEVPTVPTTFSASKDAWLYTEIWNTGRDGKKLAEPKSIRVTGTGTNGEQLTSTEKQWMGGLPIGAGEHAGMEFEISYYWMLKDGRYRTDTKKITLVPGKYDLSEKVYNESGSPNNTALKLGTNKGSNTSVTSSAAHNVELKSQPWSTNVLAAWEVMSPEDTSVISLELIFSHGDDVVSCDPENKARQPVLYNPEPGDKITVSVPFYGYREIMETPPGGDKYKRLVSSYEPVDVELTYTVKEKKTGDKYIRYLEFDKNVEKTSSGWNKNLTAEGIKVNGTPFANMNINDISFDMVVNLVVSEEYGLSLTKLDGTSNQPMKGVKFNMYELADSGVHSLKDIKKMTPSETVTVNGTAQSKTGTGTNDSGKLKYEKLKTNKWYYLVEHEAPDGYFAYDGMIRVNRDEAGIITMQRLNENGKPKGEVAVYNPDGTGNMGTSFDASGNIYVSTTVKNYQVVEMPASGGPGSFRGLYIIFGVQILAVGIVMFLILRTKKKK